MLVAEGYDIGEAYWADHVELYGTARQARRLLLRGFRVTSRPLAPLSGFAIPDDFPPGLEDYHNYAEMTADLQALAAAYPQFVHIITLGNSFEGREHHRRAHLERRERQPVRAGRLLRRPASRARAHDRRGHARRSPTTSSTSSQVSVRALIYSRQIYIFPSLNPDGSEYDIATGTSALAQEPPAERAGGRHRQQPELQLPLGLLRRLERQRGQRDVPRAEPALRTREPARWPTS